MPGIESCVPVQDQADFGTLDELEHQFYNLFMARPICFFAPPPIHNSRFTVHDSQPPRIVHLCSAEQFLLLHYLTTKLLNWQAP
jgi:hypothetical protein